jgi:hypothetical protein
MNPPEHLALWNDNCRCFLRMSFEECRACKNLLTQAGLAILSHLEALSRLEKAAIDERDEDFKRIQAKALDAKIARENAVMEYQNHRAVHELKARTSRL